MSSAFCVGAMRVFGEAIKNRKIVLKDVEGVWWSAFERLLHIALQHELRARAFIDFVEGIIDTGLPLTHKSVHQFLQQHCEKAKVEELIDILFTCSNRHLVEPAVVSAIQQNITPDKLVRVRFVRKISVLLGILEENPKYVNVELFQTIFREMQRRGLDYMSPESWRAVFALCGILRLPPDLFLHALAAVSNATSLKRLDSRLVVSIFTHALSTAKPDSILLDLLANNLRENMFLPCGDETTRGLFSALTKARFRDEVLEQNFQTRLSRHVLTAMDPSTRRVAQDYLAMIRQAADVDHHRYGHPPPQQQHQEQEIAAIPEEAETEVRAKISKYRKQFVDDEFELEISTDTDQIRVHHYITKASDAPKAGDVIVGIGYMNRELGSCIWTFDNNEIMQLNSALIFEFIYHH